MEPEWVASGLAMVAGVATALLCLAVLADSVLKLVALAMRRRGRELCLMEDEPPAAAALPGEAFLDCPPFLRRRVTAKNRVAMRKASEPRYGAIVAARERQGAPQVGSAIGDAR